MKINFKTLIISIAIPLLVGMLSGFITGSSADIYSNLNTPPLSPPSILFPIVWTILYILMGVSSYLVYTSDAPKTEKMEILRIYGLQLLVNFIWPILFFNFNLYWFSFVWILLLIFLIVIMIFRMKKVSPIAGFLQIPYLIWVVFATYLNLAIAILN